MDHSALVPFIPEVLEAFDLELVGNVRPVAGGTLNWNFCVETSGGPRFIRRYREDLETERIHGEHALVAWSALRGIPAPSPECDAHGDTLHFGAGGRWAVFPWARGTPVARGSLSPARATAFGELHGRVQATLAEHRDSEGAVMRMRWSREEALDLLDRVQAAAAARERDPAVLAAISRHRAMLQSLDILPPEAFAELPCQLLHGDFHDQQVLFEGDEISALVDWEIWHADPRAWELIRSLAFSRLLESPRMEDYLRGYGLHVRMTERECHLAWKLWWQYRVVGSWVWAAYFLQGNERVREFFPETIRGLDLVADRDRRRAIEDRFLAAMSP
jgi:homoserine kinase type II